MAPMLTFLNLLQLVLYVALLALLGQGLLYVLAGAKRETNIFYTLLRVVSKPFTWVVRRFTPAKVADRHVPIVTFGLLLIAYAVVTFEKINYCVGLNMVGCK
jgi:cytochrome b561